MSPSILLTKDFKRGPDINFEVHTSHCITASKCELRGKQTSNSVTSCVGPLVSESIIAASSHCHEVIGV